MDQLIADIPKYEISFEEYEAHSEMKENCQEIISINSTETEPSSMNALMALPTPSNQAEERSARDTGVSWRSIASLQGESIDDALEQAKTILENANIREAPTLSGRDQVFNKPTDPRRRPQQNKENQEVIVIGDSFESFPSDHLRQITTPSVKGEVIVLEDFDSEVQEVTVKEPELKPVEDDNENDDEDFGMFFC